MTHYIGCNTTEIFYVVSSGEIVVAEGAPIMVGHCPMIYIEGGGTVPFSSVRAANPDDLKINPALIIHEINKERHKQRKK